MRFAIATSTGPAEWGLPIDWDVMATFEVELKLQQESATRGL